MDENKYGANRSLLHINAKKRLLFCYMYAMQCYVTLSPKEFCFLSLRLFYYYFLTCISFCSSANLSVSVLFHANVHLCVQGRFPHISHAIRTVYAQHLMLLNWKQAIHL